jgi:hypothetical protein
MAGRDATIPLLTDQPFLLTEQHLSFLLIEQSISLYPQPIRMPTTTVFYIGATGYIGGMYHCSIMEDYPLAGLDHDVSSFL